MNLDMKQLYWIAGFLEGEGSFAYHKKNRTATVTAAQKQLEPLQRLKSILNRGTIYFPHKSGVSYYFMYGNHAISLMMTLYAIMSPRRQGQIEKAIQIWKSMPGSGIPNKDKMHCPQGHPYDEENTCNRVHANGRWKMRLCRACHRIKEAKKRQARKEKCQ